MATEEFNVELNIKIEEVVRVLTKAVSEAHKFDEAIDLLIEDSKTLSLMFVNRFKKIDDAFGKSKNQAVILRNEVEALKTQIRDTADRGVIGMGDLEKGMMKLNRTMKAVDPSSITRAFQEVKAEAKSLELLKITPEGELRKMLKNTEMIKEKIRELANSTNASFDQVAEAFKRVNRLTKEFRIDDVDRAVRQLNESMKVSSQTTMTLSQRVRDFRSSVKEIKSEIRSFQRTSLASTEVVIASFRELNRETKRFTAAEMTQAMRELRDEGKQTNAVLGNLRISTIAWGQILGNLARDALHRAVGLMREFIAAGESVAQTQRKFVIGVRALQRSGMDITFAEANAELEKLGKQFSFFTDRQIKEGLSQIMLLTRNVKLNKEEMFQLAEAAGKLSLITGKDFGEQSFGIARSIASGYTEALQNAGIEASRAAIEFEAAALGINKGFQAMTQQERASVTLALVLRQLKDMGEDVELAQVSLATQLEGSRSKWEQTKDLLGTQLLPVYIAIHEALVGFAEFLVGSFRSVQLMGIKIWGTLTGVVVGTFAAIKAAQDGHKISVQEWANTVSSAIQQVIESWTFLLQNQTSDPFQEIDAPIGEVFSSVSEEIGDELQGEVDDLQSKIDDILAKFARDVRDALINLQRKFQDIDIRAGRKREDAERKFAQDVEKLNRQTADKIADAWRKFRDKEVKAEEDFQRKMKDLREKFLFDLEDALRERDAKQVLRLIRQFNMRKNQLASNAKREKDQRKKDLTRELRDIQIQRERKLRELDIELKQRMETIAIARERELADANKWFLRRFEDLERQKQDRLDLLKAEIEEALALQRAAEIAKLQIALEGQRALESIQRRGGKTKAASNKGTREKGSSGGDGSPALGFAHGGTLVAKKPTLALFGESGAEVVNFTPMHRLGANEGRVFGGSLPGRGGGNGRAEIEVTLSDKLVAEVKDDTLGEVADLIVREMSG